MALWTAAAPDPARALKSLLEFSVDSGHKGESVRFLAESYEAFMRADPARYIRIGSTAGDVKVTSRAGDTVTIPNVQIGEVIVGDIMRIHATGTTATGITAWYDPEI